MSISDKLERIKSIGFTVAGCWKLTEGKLSFEPREHANTGNVLYAFVVSDELMYIGKTRTPLKERMDSYKYGTKSTNLKNKCNILETLTQGKGVEVLVLPSTLLPNDGLFDFVGFCISLVAGLEDTLIRDLAPPWNGKRKTRRKEEEKP